MLEATKKSYQNPDEFLYNYKEFDEYKNSPVYQLMEIMREFNSSNGYNDIFIPAMKQLNSSYPQHFHHTEVASKKLLEQYPGIEKLNNLIFYASINGIF